jgi:23S rRNA pseudouridine2605 synthase
MHPRFGVEKTYEALVAGSPGSDDVKRLLEGVYLSDGRVKARYVKKLKRQGESTWLRVVLCEGKNREIRRMLAKLGHKVMRLRRTAIGPVKLDRLPKGKSRKLSLKELKALRHSIAGRQKQQA